MIAAELSTEVNSERVHTIDDPSSEEKCSGPVLAVGLWGQLIFCDLDQLPGLPVAGLSPLAPAGGVLGAFEMSAGPTTASTEHLRRRWWVLGYGLVAACRALVLHRGARVSRELVCPSSSIWLDKDEMEGMRSGPQPGSVANLFSR